MLVIICKAIILFLFLIYHRMRRHIPMFKSHIVSIISFKLGLQLWDLIAFVLFLDSLEDGLHQGVA